MRRAKDMLRRRKKVVDRTGLSRLFPCKICELHSKITGLKCRCGTIEEFNNLY